MIRYALLFGALILFSFSASFTASAQVSGDAFSGFSSNSNSPIAIDADELEVLDEEAKAVFSGNVEIRQGASLIRTSRLVVHYVRGASENGATGANDIDRLVLSGGLVATSDNNTATADNGVYMVKSENVILNGNVVVSQGESIAKGCKLVANLRTNIAKLEACGGRVRSIFKPGS